MREQHGKHKTDAYKTWCAMKQRCLNPNYSAYRFYGGRGIKVCERWLSFSAFYADMGDRPPGKTLDRVNSNGHYSPKNCRWATRKQQQNNRDVCVLLTYKRETMTLMQWSDRTGIPYNTLALRHHSGWPPKKVLTPGVFRDLSGLAIGGIANGARLKARTHCVNGHPFDKKNTHIYRGNRVCRPCKNAREKGRQAAIRASR